MPKGEVAVAVFNYETEALMMVELLKAEGIPCVLVPIGVGAGGLGPTIWRPFEIRVRPIDERRARQVLEASSDS